MRKRAVVSVLAVFFQALAGSYVLATEIRVAPDGSGDVGTIAEAMAIAEGNDEIVLEDGVFSGPGNREFVVGTVGPTIRSASGDPALCIIDLENHRGFSQATDVWLTLDGITLRNGNNAEAGGAIQLEDGLVNLFHCRFENNYSGNRGGAVSIQSWGWWNIIEDCRFLANHAADEGAALYANSEFLSLDGCIFEENVGQTTVSKHSMSGGFANCQFYRNTATHGILWINMTWADVEHCVFVGNESGTYYGTLRVSDANTEILDCTFVDNGGGLKGDIEAVDTDPAFTVAIRRCVVAFSRATYGVVGDPNRPPLIECTDIYTEGAGWHASIAAQAGSNGNLDADPLFCDPAGGNFTLADISPCLPANNSCGVQIGFHGQGCVSDGYVVYPDGHGAIADIQTAIDIVPAGGEILLADGVFTGEGNHDLDFHGKALTLRSLSGNPAACVLDAGGVARCFRFHSLEGPGAVVRGITLRGGWSDAAGGAVLVESASPWFADCRFEDNAAVWGGGIAATADAWPVLRGCVFSGNEAVLGAAISVQSAHADVFSCTVAGNHADGAALFGQDGLLRLEQSIVAHNTGGRAVWVMPGAEIHLTACDIFGNEGGDWTEPFAAQLDLRANFLAPPCFCDLAGGVLSLCADSWCLPENNPLGNGLLVGALGMGCEECGCGGPVAAEVRGLVATPEAGRVVIRWSAPLHQVDEFGLTAVKDGASWPVDVVAGDPDFVATDADVHLAGGGLVTYLLAMNGLVVGEVVAEVPPFAGVSIAAHPNPFNPSTTITYRIDQAGYGRVVVFDLRGRRVATLRQETMPVGEGQVIWNGRDDAGRAVEAGTYICRLECAGGVRKVSITLVK